jgi:hypothetical protein
LRAPGRLIGSAAAARLRNIAGENFHLLNHVMTAGTHENRRFHRMRPSGPTAKNGTIFADLKSQPIACSIVDTSAGGACIEVHGSAPIPKKFILNQGGVKKTCYLVWQKGRRVGVSF